MHRLLIDSHSHFVGEEVLDALRRDGGRCETPVETCDDGKIFVMTPERPYGPITPDFHDLSLRQAFLDKLGITRQILTPPPFLFYSWTRDPLAYSLMEMENDSIAGVVAAKPDRFAGFATVMLQDVDASVRECERVAKAGLVGIELGSNINGRALDDPAFWPFYEATESLDMAILIHPCNVAGADRMADYHLRNLIGFPTDTTLTAAKLIFSGVLDRFPRLRICLGQAGGFLPYIIGRLDAGYKARPECQRNISNPPSQYMRRFYYDTIIHSADALRFLIESVGPDRVMLGTDFPFDMSAASPVDQIDRQDHLTNEEKNQILHATATEFLGQAA